MLSANSVGRLLAQLGITCQKPLHRAQERDEALVKQWLRKDYPKIKALAQREKAEIFFGDAAHMRSDHHAGRTWGKRGKTPIVETTGARHRMSLISAITARGHMRFMIKEKGGVNAAVFIEFLKRLMAGDVANFFDIVFKERRRIEHWDNAVKQGRLAAQNMLGRRVAYDEVSYFFCNILELSFNFLGSTREIDERIGRGSLEDRSFTLFYLKNNVGLTASPRGVWARGRAGIGLSFWRGRASGVRSPFSRKEIPNVTVAYADDRRHEAGGFIAGNASHLH